MAVNLSRDNQALGETSGSEKSPVLSQEPRVEEYEKIGAPQVGELRPDEVAAGGLGRHLGIFSTTFLMYVLDQL